jgi:cytochrome c oxidase cbb3-type subunit III
MIIFVLSSCLAAAQTQAPSDKTPDNAAARGRSQFSKSCAFCHGANATGGPEGPNLTQSSIVRHDKGGDLIGPVIREGRPGRGMPPIPLQADQISDVVAYLHSRIAELDRRSAGRPPASYALARLLTGNAARGKAFFYGPGHCSQCHSITGDLAGIASKYPPIELQTRFLYPPNVPQTATVRLDAAHTVKGEVVYLDAFTISIRDSNGWTRSWPRDTVKIELDDPLAGHRELLDRLTESDMHDVFAFLETLK